MMAGMLTQLPLPLLPAGAAEIAPGVGLVAGAGGGGLVAVHGLATFAWAAGDEGARRVGRGQPVRVWGGAEGGRARGARGRTGTGGAVRVGGVVVGRAGGEGRGVVGGVRGG